MTAKRALATASLILLLAACHKDGGVPPATAPQAAAPTAPAFSVEATPASATAGLKVTPASLTKDACDNGVEANIAWDASAAGVATDSTEVWVSNNTDKPKLFSAGGAKGETKTGNWTHPGTRFVLRNKSDGKVIGEAVVGGPHCG